MANQENKPKEKKEKTKLSDDVLRIILLVSGAVVTTLVLCFSVLTIMNVAKYDYKEAPKYLFWVFIFLGLTRFFTYIKDRTKVSLIRFISMLVFDIALGVMVFFAKENPYIFSLSAGLYSLSIIVSRVFKLIERHRARDIVLNALVILFCVLMAIGLFQKVPDDMVAAIILIECLFIAGTAFVEVATIAFAQLKLKVLVKIIVRTYALEVLFGLLTLMVAFSLVLMNLEPEMTNFGDALWYCFAVVTTIGFGDIKATTLIGRLLSVVLGMYGIIVVAVITSIIVNFYNETTTSKQDIQELKDIQKDEEEKKKK